MYAEHNPGDLFYLFSDVANGSSHSTSRRVRFSPPLEHFTLCNYTVKRLLELPIFGVYHLKVCPQFSACLPVLITLTVFHLSSCPDYTDSFFVCFLILITLTVFLSVFLSWLHGQFFCLSSCPNYIDSFPMWYPGPGCSLKGTNGPNAPYYKS